MAAPTTQRRAFLRQLTYAAANSALAVGYERTLEFGDLPALDARSHSLRQVALLEAHWARHDDEAGANHLASALLSSYGPRFARSWLLELLEQLLGFVAPLAMRSTIHAASPGASPVAGILTTLLLFASSLAKGVGAAWSLHVTTGVGMDIHSALVGKLYRKAFRMLGTVARGDVLNAQSSDTLRCANVVSALNALWTAPLSVVTASALLYREIGVASLAGLATLLCLVPAQSAALGAVEGLRVESSRLTDVRLSLLSEAINTIKSVKLASLEGSYLARVSAVRAQELDALRSQSYWHAISSCATFVAPTITATTTFLAFASLGHHLDAGTTFTVLGLYAQLRLPLSSLPLVLFAAVESAVSAQRIADLLAAPELTQATRAEGASADPVVVRMRDATFAWDPQQQNGAGLRVEDLALPKGSLCLVLGKTGSGKSTLLQAILGHVELVRGYCRVAVRADAQVGFCDQTPWTQSASVQENVLFGHPLFAAHYRRVLRCCQLESDLRQMVAGDRTEIGEKGSALSGGQRQRISLARAAYSGASLVLLDDALSALDPRVAQSVMVNAIVNPDVLGATTRVLATHQLGFLPHADYVAVVADGAVSFFGSFSTFATSSLGAAMTEPSASSRQAAGAADASGADAGTTSPSADDGAGTGNAGPLPDDAEERATGALAAEVVLRYVESAGGSIYGAVAFVLLAELAQASSDVWLSRLSDLSGRAEPGSSTTMHVLGLYALQGVLVAILSFYRGVAVVEAAIHAASRLHAALLEQTLRASLGRHFDVTPAGRHLSRASKDVDALDTSLADTGNSFAATVVLVLGTSATLVALQPLLLLVCVPLSLGYAALMAYYRASARELSRLSATQSSPVYAGLSETLTGLTTVSAFCRAEDCRRYNAELLDDYHACYWLGLILGRWLNVRLEVIGALVVLGAGFTAVAQRDRMGSGQVGLCMSYALQIVGALEMVVSGVTAIETQLNAVERVLQYAHHLPVEAPYLLAQRPAWGWLSTDAEVRALNLSARYRDHLPTVLDAVSLTIPNGEKVGLVGRTGCGKSSLFLALLRILEPTHGTIVLGGTTTSRIGLRDLRTKLVVVPQDPTLCSGTTRSNLDPYGEHADRDLIAALQATRFLELGCSTQAARAALDAVVAEEGANLSVGQRQLVCLARAILRRCRLLLLDEATASLDMATDLLVQATIRREFSAVTTLAIAHRLDTLLDCDRLVLLASGSVSEVGKPQHLLRRERGTLAEMVRSGARHALLNA